ncbi:MAG: hypothetical protein ACI8X5_004123 [Planctomycetota bacterium]|jgi:hypothetical protein
MHTPKTRTLPPLDRATPGELEHALLHWDELEPASLVALASHPEAGKRLAGLRTVERWMSEQIATTPVATTEGADSNPIGKCPSAELLFDFGRGPGFAQLGSELEGKISEHLGQCEDCSHLVKSLQTPPPLPLDFSLVSDEEHPPIPELDDLVEPARPMRPAASLRPFLVAASLAGIALIPLYMSVGGSSLADLPQAPIFRGAALDQLHFPRGPLLALTGENGATSAIPSFEMEAIAEATEYRVELFQNEGGAFDSGSRIQNLRSQDPIVFGAPLTPGHYTWRGWAEVDGLERDLGALDFQVVANAGLAASASALGKSPGTSELIELIGELHESGFTSDARTTARRLPASPERDEYLAPPAR